MPKIQSPPKIRAEDFKSEDQELISKIGGIYNPFAEEVYSVLSGRIDFTNLNQQVVDVDVMINSTGTLVAQPQVRTTLLGKVRGAMVVNAINLVDPNTYPTTAPFVSFTINSNILTILNVTGLQNSSQYKLTLLLIV